MIGVTQVKADITPKTSTPAAGNTYYLYNSTLHGFLSKSGAEAYLTVYGDAWNVEESGSNYKFRLKDDVNGYFGGTWWAGIGSGNSSTEFAITSVSGGYTLRNLTAWPSENNALVYINTDNHGRVACNYAADFTAYTKWLFVSESDYQDYVDALKGSNGIDITTMSIINPSFEKGDKTGWTVEPSDAGQTGVFENTGGKAMTGGDGSYLFNIWWQGKPMTQPVGTLPAGVYRLSAVTTTDKDAKTYLKVNDGHNDGAVSTNGAGTGVANEYGFVLNEATETTIGVVGCANDDEKSYSAEGYYWYKVDNFHLKYYGENNYTGLINNAAIVNGNGWTGANTNSGQQYTGAPDNTYLDRNNAEANMYQQISLPAGKYIVQAATRASSSQGTAYLYLLEVGANNLDTHDVEKKGNTGNVLGNGWGWTFLCFELAEAKTVQLGFYMNKSSWAGADDFRLYKVDDGVPTSVINALSSMILSEPKMNASVRAAQTSAKTTLESSKTYEDFKALRSAIDVANAGEAAYKKANEQITKMNSLLENTNFYTATARSAIDAQIEKYNNETLTTDEANNLSNTFFSSTKNAGLAAKLIMSNFEVNGETSNPPYYANTWSNEGNTDGSNMTTPFLEYWVADGSILANRNLTATQTGLKNNTTYAIRALVRVKKSSGSEEATPSGITMQVGSGQEIDVCAGTNINTSYWYGTFTANGTTDGSGNLVLNFKVEDTSVSWLAIKNIKFLELDFSALATAISNTEAVLGFENGEYAPYANTAKMTALANAKNVLNGTTSVSTQNEIDSYTDALNNAAWTVANSGSVNAVYNPTFSLSTDNGAMAGWSTNDGTTLGTAGHSRAFVLTSGMTNYDNLEPFGQGDGTRSCAYLRWDGYNSKQTTRYIYGATTGYTMPLKTDVLYRLTLELGGWGQTGKSIKVAITNEAGTELSSETENTDATGINDGGKNLTSYSFDFRPNTAGNYYLVISNPGSGVNNAIVVSNISIMSVDELAEHTEAVKAGDITSLVQNPDFQSAATGWNGYTNYPSLTRGWRGEAVTDKFIERTSTGAMSQVIYNMPAGTYKVVAAARGYNGGKITASLNGTTGATLNCTGDTQSGAAEINTNGVQMPYSSAGGFTKDNNGHNWQWISATAVLNEAGNLTISFNTVGSSWMAIDDVHLYYMSDAYDGHAATNTYCITAPTISGSQTIDNSDEVVTCDIVVTNPNAIISSDEAITGAAGTQINNNLVSGTVANLVLYDGTYEFSADADFEATAATLYRSVAANGFATICAPFAISGATGTFYQPASLEDGTLTFETESTPVAGKAYLYKAGESAVASFEGSGDVKASPVDNGEGVVMKGTYSNIAAVPADDYVLSGTSLYKVNSTVSLKPFRAYFEVPSGDSGARITLNFDEDPTAINVIEATGTEAEGLKDGKYLIGGKIVIVKNGVQYGTNGQKLN